MVKTKKKLKCPIIIIFYTFYDNSQNVWAEHYSSKTVKGNMSRMHWTKVNIPTKGVAFDNFNFSLRRLPWNLEI